MANTRPTPITSPKGTFRYPKLIEPDTKFKAEGEFSVGLILPATDKGAVSLMKMIDEAAAASLAEAKEKAKTPAEAKKWDTKYLPYANEEDPETGEPTGNVIFKFTKKASGVTKAGKAWTSKVRIFDAKGKPVLTDINIGGGTVGKVSFVVIPYAATVQSGASVKLALEAVQIIELRSYGADKAEDYGFGEEEGYAAEAATPFDADDDETQGDDF